MATKSLHSYKRQMPSMRQQLNEGDFRAGMQYHENPLPTGANKLLVNFNITDAGARLKPRGGKQAFASATVGTSADGKLHVHHSGAAFVKRGTDAEYRRYVLCGQKAPDNSGMLFSKMALLIEKLDGSLIKSTLNASYNGNHIVRCQNNADFTTMHNVPVESPRPVGVLGCIEGNTYVLTQNKIARIEITTDGNENFTHNLVEITHRDIGAIQAVNYGYNMLDPQPYDFPNTQGVGLRLQGILPYDPGTGLLKLNAKVGESVRFRLNYEYPAGAPTYKVQWEVQDIHATGNPTVLQKAADSPVYTAGADIYIDASPTFKQFSIVAKVFLSTDVTNVLKVIQLASYYMSADSNDKNKNLSPTTFNLMTAKDCCVYNNQLVLWGVSGANMTLFLSDTNDPSYFPFPQNAHPFNEEILRVVPFLDQLLVFTESRVHLFVYVVGSGFVTRTIQDNLKMRRQDMNTIITVKNMVFFKSDEYFYMIVPSIKQNNETELQIAPISKPITVLLDNFKREMFRVIDDLYTLEELFKVPSSQIDLRLQYFYNYLDNAAVHNVYKYKIVGGVKTLYLDVHLNYDTLLRAWYVEVFETNDNPVLPYRRVATANARYINLWLSDASTYSLQSISINDLVPVDNIYLDYNQGPKTLKNYQLIDTGKRDIAGTIKKRFREVMLEVNNLSGSSLAFNDVFIVDDDVRKDLFEYNVAHITDPLSEEYGTIYVERTYVDPTIVSGLTKLSEWRLDFEQFPEQTLVKVRLVDIKGKGYYPRLRLISRNEIMYELNQIGWVFRDMNAR